LLICEKPDGSAGGYRGGQMLTAELQPSRAIPVGQESEVADFHEARWQDVKHETADELDRIQGHRLGAAVVLGIPPTKTDLALFTAQQSAIRDGHPMGVAGQILQHVLGSAKRRLCVNYPIGLLEYPQPGLKANGICEGSQPAAELQFSLGVGVS
jgi:hypothetical protein